MTFLISLLLKSGLGQRAAGIAAKLILVLAALALAWLLYFLIWAKPQGTIKDLQGQIDAKVGELATCLAGAAQWEASANSCSAATAAAATAGATRAAGAAEAARAAHTQAQSRRVALLAGHGPDAMNRFYREVYQ